MEEKLNHRSDVCRRCQAIRSLNKVERETAEHTPVLYTTVDTIKWSD
jgi:hypothetical protein